MPESETKNIPISSVTNALWECRDCGCESSDVYWFSCLGARLKKPRCACCHEKAVVSGSSVYEEGTIEMSGCQQRVYGRHVRGIYLFREEK
jgi:hypothetical protein